MGLRQSKRSVDITASPKKEAAAEKSASEGTIEKIDEEVKAPVNGDAKTPEPTEAVIYIRLLFTL